MVYLNATQGFLTSQVFFVTTMTDEYFSIKCNRGWQHFGVRNSQSLYAQAQVIAVIYAQVLNWASSHLVSIMFSLLGNLFTPLSMFYKLF